MGDIQKTNICCLDLPQDCIDYLKTLGVNVYEGSLGSVFYIKWGKNDYGTKTVLSDVNYPTNLHEYHIFIHDMENPHKRNYYAEEHQLKIVDSGETRHLECLAPVNKYDLRPYGLHWLSREFKAIKNHRRIEVLFTGSENSVVYRSNAISSYDPKPVGPFSNINDWNLVRGFGKYGLRVKLEGFDISKALFESRQNQVTYNRVFLLPTVIQGEKRIIDQNYISLLRNADDECISYIYCRTHDYIQVVLPQVEDKAALLKDLFEKVLLRFFSEFFPDVQASSWIQGDSYLLPDERDIKQTIKAKRAEFEMQMKGLEEEEAGINEKNKPLKQLLTETGSTLVSSSKLFLEWLGFENVIDKDETLAEDELKEEDICFDYEGTHVIIEVKGINGTSTDAECSQIDKIVNRRMRQLNSTKVHGIYIVNNQKNVEPLKRCIPPFNEIQIKDAESQNRTMVYTAQLFALYSDIKNGFITKKQVRESLMQSGLADFHKCLTSLGVPYHYYRKDTLICLELDGTPVSVGDTLLFKDEFGRLVGCNVESIEQDNTSIQMASLGKVGVKVDRTVPRGRDFFLNQKLTHQD